MNALGDRCRSVVVLVDSTSYAAPLLEDSHGYHVGCVVASPATDAAPSASPSASAKKIVKEVEHFCGENRVSHRCIAVSRTAGELQELMGSSSDAPASAAASLSTPLTLLDCTAVAHEGPVAALLTWLYGEPPAAPAEGTEPPYTLVAVLDMGRGVACPPPSTASTSSGGAYAWLRPTPSYYSELVETAGGAVGPCTVYPVHMFSRYPVLRDRGLREFATSSEGVVTATPVAEWTNKSTLGALLRELAFKAGQLAKYGA